MLCERNSTGCYASVMNDLRQIALVINWFWIKQWLIIEWMIDIWIETLTDQMFSSVRSHFAVFCVIFVPFYSLSFFDAHGQHSSYMVSVSLTTLGSLSKGIFERHTATRNGTFSLFTCLGATTFVILGVFTLIEMIYLKIRTHPLRKNEKLPVAIRRSKTVCLSSLSSFVTYMYCTSMYPSGTTILWLSLSFHFILKFSLLL